MNFQTVTAGLVALCISSTAVAGAVNSLSVKPTDTKDTPSCDVRRVVLDKCDANVREHILNNCYVVVQKQTSLDEEFDCTWQSCNGVSLVGSRPKAKILKNPNVTEIDEFGVKFYTRSMDPSLNCTIPNSNEAFNAGTESVECLPNPSDSILFFRDRELKSPAGLFPRAYMKLKDALKLAQQSQESGNEAQRKLKQLSTSKVLTTNPYLDCAVNEKVYVWVLYDKKDTFSGKIAKWNSTMTTTEPFTLDFERQGGEYVTVGKEEDVCKRLIRNWIPTGKDVLDKLAAYCKKGEGNGTVFKTFKEGDRIILPEEQSSFAAATSPTAPVGASPSTKPAAVASPSPAPQTCAALTQSRTVYKNYSRFQSGGCSQFQIQTKTNRCYMQNGSPNYMGWSADWTPVSTYIYDFCK